MFINAFSCSPVTLLAYCSLSNNNTNVYHVARKFTYPVKDKGNRWNVLSKCYNYVYLWLQCSPRNGRIEKEKEKMDRRRSREQGRRRQSSPLLPTPVIDNRLYHDTHSCPLSLLPSSLFHVWPRTLVLFSKGVRVTHAHVYSCVFVTPGWREVRTFSEYIKEIAWTLRTALPVTVAPLSHSSVLTAPARGYIRV